MDDKIKIFLQESTIAEKVKLQPRVVIHRTQFSAENIAEIRRNGKLPTIPKNETIAELMVGDVCLAEGRIQKKQQRYVFTITRSFVE
jgi:hypothetical protein